MRKMTRLFFITLFVLSINFLSAQNTQAAIVYMNGISENLGDVKGETWRYLKAATRGKSARTVENKRQDLVQELENVQSKVKRTPGFEGNSAYRDEVLDYVSLTITVIKGDYEKILDMEEIAERSYDNMEAFLLAKELASAKLDSAFEIYSQAQKDFAEQNNINLVEGDQSRKDEKIEKASNALTYYNKIFLITFKASVQESYVLDALNRNDLISLEQNINALKAASEEGLTELKTTDKFGSDPKLILGAQQLLDFYLKESNRDFPPMVDFYLKKDKFEKLAGMMESKKQKDLTKEEIEAYNKAVEDYNKMIPQFNKLNDRTNKAREQANKRWRDKVEAFFDAYA